LDAQTSTSKSEKLLNDESIRNMSAKVCCYLNYYYNFPHEKTSTIHEEFRNLSFEGKRAFILDVPRRLHNKLGIRKQKFITV
jgi:hypothetical protein